MCPEEILGRKWKKNKQTPTVECMGRELLLKGKAQYG
jgi:hypothetical protein